MIYTKIRIFHKDKILNKMISMKYDIEIFKAY